MRKTTKLKKLEVGGLYRTKRCLFLGANLAQDTNRLCLIPAQAIICFLGFNRSNHKKLYVSYGEYVGWLILEDQRCPAAYQFLKPRQPKPSQT